MYDPEMVLNPEGLNVYEVPEDYDLGEIDEVRINEAAELMYEVFPEEVVSNWPDLPAETKEALLDEYAARLSESLGIDTLDVIVDYDIEPGTLGYTNGHDGTIHINAEYVNSGTDLTTILNTVAHETRHCFQQEAINHPEKYPDIPQELIDRWDYENNNYIDGSYDPFGYAYQDIEIDARNFGEDVYNAYEAMLNF